MANILPRYADLKA